MLKLNDDNYDEIRINYLTYTPELKYNYKINNNHKNYISLNSTFIKSTKIYQKV